MKNTHFRLGFTRFLVISGPWAHHYFSRQAREVILMGPRTGNDQKTGKTRRKWVFFILRNQSALKLKKVVHITVYSFVRPATAYCYYTCTYGARHVLNRMENTVCSKYLFR